MTDTTITDILTEYNPWWVKAQENTGIVREKYLSKIIKYARTGEITVLNGVRRSGKTTLLHQTIEYMTAHGKNPRSILFVNCDDPHLHSRYSLEDILEAYRREIYGGEGITLVFDEIQSIDGWQRQIKAWYDLKKYTIIISGSTSSLLTSDLASLISGRYLKITVYPLDFAEYLMFKGVNIPKDRLEMRAARFELIENLRNYMNEGGFPAVVSMRDEELKKEFINGYYNTIIYRDIERIHEIRNPKVLHDLIEYLLANTALPFSYGKIAKMLDSDVSTVKDYIEYAQEAYLICELRSFSYSLKVQNTGPKKIYAIDGGLRNAVSFRFSEDAGRLAENLVYLSLLRSGFEPYFRKNKNEVDFVVKHGDYTLSAINVCYSDDIPERETKGLTEFDADFAGKVNRKVIITKDLEKEEEGILYIPLYRWLLDGAGTILNGNNP